MLKLLKRIFRKKKISDRREYEFECIYAGPDFYKVDPPVTTDENGVVVGKALSCDIVIVNNTVSKRHCQIRWFKESSSYFIRDLSSVNGTYLNGERINTTWTPLKIGDIITIGYLSYSFEKEHPQLDVLRYEKGQHFK